MLVKNKGGHEELARFFESPTRESFRNLVQNNWGENNHLDFKAEWPSMAKLARHTLAMANSGGGVLIVGVTEEADGSLESTGLVALTDKAKIGQGIEKFIPSQIEYEVLDFSISASEYQAIQGKKFQIMIVEDTPKYVPFISRADSDGIRKSAIYVRRSTSSEEATYEELQMIINRRLETQYSSEVEFDLEKEVAELKILYSHISYYRKASWATVLAIGLATERNPVYPEESFDHFVARMIKVKKQRIEDLVNAQSQNKI